jgi:hypothetical protein
MTIGIGKNLVYEEVAKITAYIGAKTNDGEAFEVVATVEENKEILDTFFLEAQNLFRMLIRKYYTNEREMKLGNTITILFELEQPKGIKENLIPAFNEIVFLFFVRYIVWKWLLLLGQLELSEIYHSQFDEASNTIKSMMFGWVGTRKLNPF